MLTTRARAYQEKLSGMELWDGSIGEGWELDVCASEVLDGAYLGCSIAVNGVCLTVTKFTKCASRAARAAPRSDSRSLPWRRDMFTVGLAPETLRRSNLGDLSSGAKVNLERALAADGRNSGHFVQGHVDNVGTIVSMKPDGDALWVTVRPPKELMAYIVPKGFIAVDGASLTVCEAPAAADPPYFSFMLVSYTQQKIIIPSKAVGDTVNLEVDVTAKYVERSMAAVLSRIEALEAKVGAS